MRTIRELLLAPLHLYRRVISPALPARCRYYPSCSQYAVEAVRSYGLIRGGILAVWRVIRCNPVSRGGFDHVHDQRVFRAL